MKWVDRLRYSKIDDFKKSLFSAWKVKGKVVGSTKSAGILELRIVNNAGHLVPMDCPEVALDLVTSFVEKYSK
jgi:carboxypeptidase C (cathepsin A)